MNDLPLTPPLNLPPRVRSFTCSGGQVLEGDSTPWGDWGRWSPTCEGRGIWGIQTAVQPPQGSGDDTALSDVRMFCSIIGHVSSQSTEGPSERSFDRPYRSELTVSNGMSWGSWGPVDMCPSGKFAAGFSLKVETPLVFGGDDTALNGIRLYCVDQSKDSSRYTSIESNVGGWGEWRDKRVCSSGFLTAFRLKVESSQGSGDDTAANSIDFKCSGGDWVYGDGIHWGDWGKWSPTCEGTGICGIQTLVEPSQGSEGDDTALNDVRMFCCD
ncbi:unnamed protein product [Leuciscus chuanchicus]